MEFKKVRPIVQFMLFIILMYGAYLGLRFTNFMPMFVCRNPPNYSFGCFLLPLHNLQYGLVTFKRSLETFHNSVVVSVPSYRYFWIGGETGAILTVFLIFILFILLFNNAWCGWACPVGSLQDVMTYLRTRIRIRRIQLSDGLKKGLNYIKIIFVTLFLTLPITCLLGFSEAVTFCKICPVRGVMTLFSGSFDNFSVTSNPGPFYNVFSSILSSVVFALAFFFSRFFCLVCPVIGLAGVFNKFSFLKIKKDVHSCNGCGSCSKACPMDLKDISLKNKNMEAVKDSCIQCYHCVDACPQSGALSVKFFGWKFFSSQKPCNFKSSQEKT